MMPMTFGSRPFVEGKLATAPNCARTGRLLRFPRLQMVTAQMAGFGVSGLWE